METTRQGPGTTPGRSDREEPCDAKERTSRLSRLIHHYHCMVAEHPGSPHTWACALFFLFVALCGVLLLPGVEPHFSHFVLYHFTTLLALTPSTLAFGYFALGRRRTFQCRKKAILDYVQFRERFARSISQGKPFFVPVIEIKDEELQQFHPRAGRYLIGAIALALPFLIVAELSESRHGVQPPFNYQPVLPPSDAPPNEGLRGLVFAGYGVFVYTLIAIVRRIQAAALSSEFLLGTSMRAAVMMTIGFAAGEVGLFTDLGTPAQALFVYFALGAFPNWGYETLRAKARSLLKPKHAGEEQLPLELVDGLDAPVVDRLEELGISDVQHLATSDPVDLTLRTLFPLQRIVDWIDQAILINYLRDKVGVARQLGIRGAIDMRAAYIQAVRPALPPGMSDGPTSLPGPWAVDSHLVLPVPVDACTRARTVLQELAIRGGLGIQSVYVIGASLANDFHVLLLSNLWHHQGVQERGALLPPWRGDAAGLYGEERYAEIDQRLLRHLGPREPEVERLEPPRRHVWSLWRFGWRARA